MRRSQWAERKQREHTDAQYRDPLQELRCALVGLGEIRGQLHNHMRSGRVIGVRMHMVIGVLIRQHAEHVVMATMNIDVLMFSIRYMGMRMTQRCQHQADTHNEAEHAQ